jgi:glycosyltransferase involved in cell wall biosynthesis
VTEVFLNGQKCSVILNCFNSEVYIAEALESVLAQTYTNIEIIVWDNQSTDNTADIVKSYDDDRIFYHKSDEHTLLGEARNKAIEMSSGELIAFIDSDDIWLKNKLELQVPLFSEPEIGLVYADTIIFNNTGRHKLMSEQTKPVSGRDVCDLALNYSISLESAVARKSALDSLDTLFDARFNAIEEYDLFVRLASRYSIGYVPLALSKWRVHGNSITWSNKLTFIKEEKIFIRDQRLREGGLPENTLIALERRRQIKLWRYTLASRGQRRCIKLIGCMKITLKLKILLFIACLPGSRFFEGCIALVRRRVTP